MVQTTSDLKLTDLRHPDFTEMLNDWVLWRDTYASGIHFINKYLVQFSNRETVPDFEARRSITHCPSYAAAALDDVKNNLFARFVDVTRAGGSKSYQEAITGDGYGVDLIGSSMNYFIGQKILPELLSMRKVGVYVDMPILEGPTITDASNKRPYIYLYRAEEICNWLIDYSVSPNEYASVLLKETYNKIHPDFGYPYGTDIRFRHMYINADGFVAVQYYDPQSNLIDEAGNEANNATYVLKIRHIPFVCFELPYSLLRDAARYQIGLLNASSSDINYILRANFPFYTEQQDWRTSSPHLNKEEANQEGEKDIEVGASSGRAYGQGLDRPGFIHPSPEPLTASMAKQDQMKRDIRLLINLAITNMSPTRQQSAGAKRLDNQGLEAGLSFIGLELERGENKIAEFWSSYENEKPATIHYPTQYSVKTDEERDKEAEHDEKFLGRVPSDTFQKELAKKIARNKVGHKVSRETWEKIEKEIDNAVFIPPDHKDLQKDVELGILDRANAAKVCLYPKDSTDIANKEHADRLLRIAETQAAGQGVTNPAARGVPDLSVGGGNGATEKAGTRQTDLNPASAAPVRGPGQ